MCRRDKPLHRTQLDHELRRDKHDHQLLHGLRVAKDSPRQDTVRPRDRGHSDLLLFVQQGKAVQVRDNVFIPSTGASRTGKQSTNSLGHSAAQTDCVAAGQQAHRPGLPQSTARLLPGERSRPELSRVPLLPLVLTPHSAVVCTLGQDQCNGRRFMTSGTDAVNIGNVES